ncbi:MAG: hypothetical protein Q7S37_01795 [bacterium]|nr:hypothetical protein [bacterium]
MLIKCIGVISRYNSNGTGYGVSGQGTWDRWTGSRSFQVFMPITGTVISQSHHYSLKWYSSLTGETGVENRFTTNSRIGLNHIHISMYEKGHPTGTGNYYLKIVPKVTKKQTEVIKPVGTVSRMINMFAKGDSAEALFQLADSVSIAQESSAKVGIEVVEIGGSVQTARASTTTRSLKVGVKDDGQSIMFPASQKVLVMTITEKLIVGTNGEAIRKVSLDKSEEVMLTIQKIRPDAKGKYKWQKK